MSSKPEEFRIERDVLGEVAIPVEAYYGVHTARALENFPVSGRSVNRHMIEAMVTVKKAAAISHQKLDHIPPDVISAIINACDEVLQGKFSEWFVVDAYQGGAGTSTNMNVNEVLANRAIELLGGRKGDYGKVHPLEHVNCCQSTNDVYPTALRIAAIKLLRRLSNVYASLQEALQKKEIEFSDFIRLGRTQLMDALPMMAGQGFGAYAKAISRDRWRLYKVEERLREVNIGGTAIGTGMNASISYIYKMTDTLKELTGYGIARSEFPMDITQNMDIFVEVSGLLKSAAVNLSKISNDIRFLASGPAGGIGEFIIPEVQAGSSIMPGKVNPVIPEMVMQSSIRVISNDLAITTAAMNGQLELNAFSPVIMESLLESIELLTKAVEIFENKCISGIRINTEKCLENVEKSSALATALVHYLGYDKASEIAKQAQKGNKTIRQIIIDEKIMDIELADKILDPFQVTKPGIPGK